MQRSFNDNAADKQRLESAMRGVTQQMAALAQDPDRRGDKGPHFVKTEPRMGRGDENEAMLGSLLLESFMGGALGDAFAEAMDVPSGLQQVDWGHVVDAYDEYSKDRHNTGFSLGKRGSIGGTFNSFSGYGLQKSLYVQDKPARMNLEQHYAALSRERDQLDRDPACPVNRQPAYGMAA